MNEKGMVTQMNDTQDLNPETIWGMKRQRQGNARTSLGEMQQDF